MPKNHSSNIYQTTAFDQYPSKIRNNLLERRKRIINLRLQSQSHVNYPETADYFWRQSEIEAKGLQQWIESNPAPQRNIEPQLNLMTKLKRWVQHLFEHQYA